MEYAKTLGLKELIEGLAPLIELAPLSENEKKFWETVQQKTGDNYENLSKGEKQMYDLLVGVRNSEDESLVKQYGMDTPEKWIAFDVALGISGYLRLQSSKLSFSKPWHKLYKNGFVDQAVSKDVLDEHVDLAIQEGMRFTDVESIGDYFQKKATMWLCDQIYSGTEKGKVLLSFEKEQFIISKKNATLETDPSETSQYFTLERIIR